MLRRLLPYLAYAYIRFVGLTTRLRVRGLEHRTALRAANQRFIYALWHQRQVLFIWTHKGDSVNILGSKSRDGELITKTSNLSGIGTCRGSSSRGAVAGLREMIKALRSGRDLAITPDGPRGPARKIKSGVIFLAQTCKIPILPITNSASRRLEFSRSWDHFQVPLPFGRAVLRYGEPIWIGPEDDVALKTAQLEASLNSITDQADRESAEWPPE